MLKADATSAPERAKHASICPLAMFIAEVIDETLHPRCTVRPNQVAT